MKALIVIMIFFFYAPHSSWAYSGNLLNVHSVINEFNESVKKNGITGNSVFEYSVKAANALSTDWLVGNKMEVSTELVEVFEGTSMIAKTDLYNLVQTPRFKIDLAGYLGMAIDNCKVNYDRNVLRFYVIEKLNSNNPRLQIAALRNLGLVGDDRDIQFLNSLIEKDIPGWSQHAASSLKLIKAEKEKSSCE